MASSANRRENGYLRDRSTQGLAVARRPREGCGALEEVGDEDMPDDIGWIRSYVLQEDDGSVGTVCIYQASSEEAIRKHADLADLPVDEVIPVADTVIVREDPA
jgi:sporulation protein YlmC with PRC-barrel domain